MSKPTDLYTQLESKTLPLLEAYQTDLTTHDKKFIEENPGVPFLHYTRAYGTTIIPLHGPGIYPPRDVKIPYLFGHANREHILENSVVELARYHANPRNGEYLRCLYFTGVTLREVSLDYAVKIAETHARHIRAIW